MEILIAINKVLDIKVVQWLLLLLVTGLIVVAGFSLFRQKVLGLQLQAAQGQVAECAAAAKASEEQRRQLEDKIASAADAVVKTRRDYETRLEKLRRSKVKPGPCDTMVREAVELLQSKEVAP